MQSGDPRIIPELAPYYRTSRRAELRRAALLILPVLAVVVIVAGLVWGGWWLAHRSSMHPKSSISTGKNQQAQVNGSPDTSQLPTYLRPSPTPATTRPTPKPAPIPATAEPPTASPTLINTGPEAGILLLPIMSAILAAAFFELRQVRSVRV